MVLQNVLVGCIEFDQDVPINQHEAICFFYSKFLQISLFSSTLSSPHFYVFMVLVIGIEAYMPH